MIQNYLKTTSRGVMRHKGYSFINITGLSIGIFLFIIIMLFVKHETSFDCFHTNYKNIYRLEGRDWAVTPAPFTDLLLLKFPEIKKIARINFDSNPILKYKDRAFRFQSLALADSSVFSVFTFKMLQGDPQTALVQPFSIVLTASSATKLFGSENALGKKIFWNNSFQFVVTGVIEDLPSNSSIETTGFGSLSSYPYLSDDPGILESFRNWNFFTYMLIDQYKPNLIDRINQFIFAYIDKQKTNGNLKEDEIKLKITRLQDIYFSKYSALDVHKKGQMEFIYIDIYIAIFIILIACVNFVNISTARAYSRAKEVAVRKIVGAQRESLLFQFVSEFVLLSLVALVFALMLVELFLPVFNKLLQVRLSVANLYEWRTLLFFVGTTILIGIISGIYPAISLSRFEPKYSIRPVYYKRKTGAVLRKLLITFQFVISITLIVFTLTINTQLKYVNTMDLGFKHDEMYYAPINNGLRNHLQEFKADVIKNPNVVKYATSYGVPGSLFLQWSCEINGRVHKFHCLPADPDFVSLAGLQIVKGRNFDKKNESDYNRAFILNETAVKEFGLKNPVGTQFTGEPFGEVVGVVKDFHFKSAHHPVEPLAIYCSKEDMNGFINFRINPKDQNKTLAYIERVWKKYSPESPMESVKLNEVYNKLYDNENRLREIFLYFSVLSIFIACLGLFGLATYIAEQRTKEIGVRRAIGASVFQIVLMLTKAYSIWVLLANLLAWPISYIMVRYWLKNFTDHIVITPALYVEAGILVFVTALATVNYQAIIAASKKPVEALRYE